MKIIVAQTAGFCMGVKRAVDLALDNVPKGSQGLFTLGPLIHNSQTIEQLQSRGIVPIDKRNAPSPESPILVRAHGVPPATEQEYRDKGHMIIDGTCPKVKTVHKVIFRFRAQGYSIVITGDTGHAEVVGLLGYAGESARLVHTVEDVNALPEYDKVCLVSQTTFDSALFDQIGQALKSRFEGKDVLVKKTICAATDKRQEETKRLATMVDAMIVVGGKNSANTMRLAQIAEAAGTPTQYVETEHEIDFEPLSRCQTVGITAGASTPHWMIRRVVEYVQYMSSKRRLTVRNAAVRAIDGLANLNILVSLGAVTAFYASCRLQRVDLPPHLFGAGAVISLLYFFSMYLWNTLASLQDTEHLSIGRHQFFCKNRQWLFAVALGSIFAQLALSFFVNRSLFYLMGFATVLGSLYHITIVPPVLRKIVRYGNLKDIPTSRDLFVALAWGVVMTFLPHALTGTFVLTRFSIFFFLWIFALAYLRSVILDLRDIEGDRIMGRETLVTVIGEKRARRLIRVALLSAFVLIAVYSVMSYFGGGLSFSAAQITYLFQTPVLVYAYFFTRWSDRIRMGRSSLFSLLSDGAFYLTGLCAWAVGVVVG